MEKRVTRVTWAPQGPTGLRQTFNRSPGPERLPSPRTRVKKEVRGKKEQ